MQINMLSAKRMLWYNLLYGLKTNVISIKRTKNRIGNNNGSLVVNNMIIKAPTKNLSIINKLYHLVHINYLTT